MILHGVKLGERTVHVRTDDLDARELDRIHEAVKIVPRMYDRQGIEALGLVIGLVVFLATMIPLMLSHAVESAPAAFGISVIPAVVVAIAGWLMIGSAIQHRQREDGQRLYVLCQESPHCRNFVLECCEASSVFNGMVGHFVPETVSA